MTATDKVNILLVDDQPGKLLTYEAMLSELGENLIKANSGKEALEHLLKHEITVVLMDVSMPVIDGFELASMIREHPRYRKTAIIFVSAVHLTDLDRVRGYQSGAVDYVSVPVVPELLRAKVSVFTELWRKTRELERLTQELEQRVAQRTADLEAAVAKQTVLADELRKVDRRKDEFLALLGHELRNPLASVTNAVGIMRTKPLDADLSWCSAILDRQASQLTRLVDDLLDVSRISQGKIKLRLDRVAVADIIAAAHETCRPQIDAKRHVLTVSLPDAPLHVTGDYTRLTQVIANLLNNAVKYQHEGGMIDLRVEQHDRVVEIRVKDAGVGIAPDMLTEVFALFAQGERAPNQAQDGLGIGLSLVKTLVDMHGGTVEARSSGLGEGAEFVVRLPAAAQELAAVRVSPGSTRGINDVPPRRILVVDDNHDAAESLAMLLRFGGHDVTLAHDGLAALASARASRPDVVLLDIGLPGIDGYEVCRRMRAEGLANEQIIAMTGYGQEEALRRAKEAGFDAHAVKPVDFRELLGLLHRPLTAEVA